MGDFLAQLAEKEVRYIKYSINICLSVSGGYGRTLFRRCDVVAALTRLYSEFPKDGRVAVVYVGNEGSRTTLVLNHF